MLLAILHSIHGNFAKLFRMDSVSEGSFPFSYKHLAAVILIILLQSSIVSCQGWFQYGVAILSHNCHSFNNQHDAN